MKEEDMPLAVRKLQYKGGKGSRKRLKAYAKPPYVEDEEEEEA